MTKWVKIRNGAVYVLIDLDSGKLVARMSRTGPPPLMELKPAAENNYKMLNALTDAGVPYDNALMMLEPIDPPVRTYTYRGSYKDAADTMRRVIEEAYKNYDPMQPKAGLKEGRFNLPPLNWTKAFTMQDIKDRVEAYRRPANERLQAWAKNTNAQKIFIDWLKDSKT